MYCTCLTRDIISSVLGRAPPCFVYVQSSNTLTIWVIVIVCGWAGVSTLQAPAFYYCCLLLHLLLLYYSTLLLITTLCTSSSPTREEDQVEHWSPGGRLPPFLMALTTSC